MAYKLEGGIYCITCLINGRKYVGATRKFAERKYHHFHALRKGTHRNDFLQRSFDKYGECNFEFTVLEIIANNSPMHEREVHWIKSLDTFNNGFNLTLGGEITKQSEYTKKKRSESLKGANNPMHGKNGELNPRCKTTADIVIKARTMIKQGINDSDIMGECNLSHNQYYKIKHYRTWKHIVV